MFGPLIIKPEIMATQPKTPGPLRDDELQPDDVINDKQQPVPPKGNQDEQSRQGEDSSEDLLDEEDDDLQIDNLLEEGDITDEDVDEQTFEEDDAEKGPMKG
jgi:DNA-directed RNA polymerase delta subunit